MEAMIIAAMLVLFRVVAFIAFMPPLAGQMTPNTVKLGLATAITVLLVPAYVGPVALLLHTHSGSSTLWLQVGVMVARESVLGAGLAWLFSLCLVPVRIAGAWVAQEMGLTMGGLSSPMDQQQTNVVSQALEALGVLMFLALNLHHIVFLALGRTFAVQPVGGTLRLPGWDSVTWSVTSSISDGFLIIAPVGILLFIIAVMLLVTMKSAPQFNFMSYGMSLRLMAGLAGLVLFFPEIAGVIESLMSRVGTLVGT